jgi:membrane-bound metal-dependent hydrolase YbcI (DUF457 family)
MTIILPTLAVAFAALCVWLTVRIVNRQRQAKWAVMAGALTALYVASFGPACWVNMRVPALRPMLDEVYSPIIHAWSIAPFTNDWIFRYANLGSPRGIGIGFRREGQRYSTWTYSVNE